MLGPGWSSCVPFRGYLSKVGMTGGCGPWLGARAQRYEEDLRLLALLVWQSAHLRLVRAAAARRAAEPRQRYTVPPDLGTDL